MLIKKHNKVIHCPVWLVGHRDVFSAAQSSFDNELSRCLMQILKVPSRQIGSSCE